MEPVTVRAGAKLRFMLSVCCIWRLCLLSFLTIIGAERPAQADQTLAQMYHTAWTVKDGAPTNVESIAQTKDGYLWLGTDNGLFRFDGKRFEHFRPTSGEDILPGIAKVVKALPDGGLLVGYPFAGASYIKDGRVTNYGPKEGWKSGGANGFGQDQEGVIWAATNSGLLRLENSSWTKVGVEWNFSAGIAINVFVDHRGTVWVGTMTGLYFLPKGGRRFRAAESTYQVSAIAEAPNGSVWVEIPHASLVKQLTAPNGDLIQNRGRYRFRGGTDDVCSILFPRDGSLWVASSNAGLFRIPSPDSRPARTSVEIRNVAQHFSRNDGLTNNYPYCLMQDQEGSIWTYSAAGIDQFRPAAFTVIEAPVDFDRTAILADGADSILVGSSGHTPLIRVIQGKPRAVPNSPHGWIRLLYRDLHGKIWVGTSDELWAFTGEKFTRHTLPKDVDPFFHVPQSMTMDRSGALWVSILHSGVMRLSQGMWTHGENLTASAHDPALFLFTDSNGRVWIGNKRNRIDVVDNEKIRHFGPEIGLDVGDVTAIYEHSHQIWIGGESGFGLFRDGRFWHMRLADDAVPKGVTGIVQTANGDLWLNQASGVVQIVANEVGRAQRDKTYRASFRLYDYLDGINTPVHQTIPLPTAIQTDDGKLYFGMRSSVAWTDPNHLPSNPIRPSVFITSIIADGKEHKNTSPVIFPPRTQNLEINFTGLSLLIPQRVQFRYLLERIDQGWQDAGIGRQALYSRLPPGEYKFRVIGSNNDRLWNEAGAEFTFAIPPSFVQSFVFKALCTLAATGILWLAYWMRLRQVTQRVQDRMCERLAERERIARDLHDTFFQGVQGLFLRFHTATSKLPQNEPTRDIFENALRQSDDVMKEGRELLLDLRSTTGDRRDLPCALAEAGSQFRDLHPCEFNVIVNGKARVLHPIVCDELSHIGKEALGNAFRHSHASQIEAEVHYETDQLRLRIRDDGEGIDPKVLKQGHRSGHWGLPDMRERAKKIGTQVDVWSQSATGTEVEVKIPARLAYASNTNLAPWFRRVWKIDKTTANRDSVST